MAKSKFPTEYKVLLTFFQDDANGAYGLAHDNAIERDFNAFWNGIGIFHDVFEHYFEGINKYFIDDYEFNIGGEICAMGHLAYYTDTFTSLERVRNLGKMNGQVTAIVSTTADDMVEAIEYGNTRFGSRLESCVPKQKDVNSYLLYSVIGEHMAQMENATLAESCTDEREIKEAKAYKRSVTENKIYNLYTYGYRLAQKIAPDTQENEDALNDFFNFWENFCKRNDAEDLTNQFESVEFTITCGEMLQWKADFIHKDGTRYSHEQVNNGEHYFYEEAA